jgi:uncharacterized protein HemX
MADQSNDGKRPLSIPALALIAVALATTFGVYLSIPVKHHASAPPAAAPDPTTQAIHDLQASQRQAADQLKVLQQTVSSDQAEIRRLAEEVAALTRKLEALQQSFASAQRAPVVEPTEPAKQKRGAR